MITEAGHESIVRAKEKGSWIILDEVEELIIPDDLNKNSSKNQRFKNSF